VSLYEPRGDYQLLLDHPRKPAKASGGSSAAQAPAAKATATVQSDLFALYRAASASFRRPVAIRPFPVLGAGSGIPY
jgi:hypothetical protein